jgi:mycoredoxin
MVPHVADIHGVRAGRSGRGKLLHQTEDCRKNKRLAPPTTWRPPVPLTMYTTTWCGFCKNLKRQLAKVGIEMDEVDIERDPEAAKFVESVNGGNQTVPTVLFADGSTLCNPSAAQVQKKLAELAATQSS